MTTVFLGFSLKKREKERKWMEVERVHEIWSQEVIDRIFLRYNEPKLNPALLLQAASLLAAGDVRDRRRRPARSAPGRRQRLKGKKEKLLRGVNVPSHNRSAH